MKYNKNTKQNKRIEYITDDFLVVGIDVGSTFHYARAFNNRGIEYSSKPFKFINTRDGFEIFKTWTSKLLSEQGKKLVIVGIEPTGHYWFNLGKFITEQGMILTHVNPAAVKKSKELDDNDPTKNDRKDPKTIAGLVNAGRYTLPYMPEGKYAEIRELSNLRIQTSEQLIRCKNRLARWFSIYFPEFKDVYKNTDSKSGLMILEKYPLPSDIVSLGVDGIVAIWKEHKLRGIGRSRAEKLFKAAQESIGKQEASMAARIEFKNLVTDINQCKSRMEEIMAKVYEILPTVPNVDKLLEISGVGIIGVLMFIAEVGDITRFHNPKEIQKLSGLSIVENSSGKHQGEYRISYRGRKLLRYALFEVAMSLISRNKNFAAIHNYYVTREKNPLKKMQSVIAIACKAIRIFYKVLVDGVEYDGEKMTQDILRPQTVIA